MTRERHAFQGVACARCLLLPSRAGILCTEDGAEAADCPCVSLARGADAPQRIAAAVSGAGLGSGVVSVPHERSGLVVDGPPRGEVRAWELQAAETFWVALAAILAVARPAVRWHPRAQLAPAIVWFGSPRTLEVQVPDIAGRSDSMYRVKGDRNPYSPHVALHIDRDARAGTPFVLLAQRGHAERVVARFKERSPAVDEEVVEPAVVAVRAVDTGHQHDFDEVAPANSELAASIQEVRPKVAGIFGFLVVRRDDLQLIGVDFVALEPNVETRLVEEQLHVRLRASAVSRAVVEEVADAFSSSPFRLSRPSAGRHTRFEKCCRCLGHRPLRGLQDVSNNRRAPRVSGRVLERDVPVLEREALALVPEERRLTRTRVLAVELVGCRLVAKDVQTPDGPVVHERLKVAEGDSHDHAPRTLRLLCIELPA